MVPGDGIYLGTKFVRWNESVCLEKEDTKISPLGEVGVETGIDVVYVESNEAYAQSDKDWLVTFCWNDYMKFMKAGRPALTGRYERNVSVPYIFGASMALKVTPNDYKNVLTVAIDGQSCSNVTGSIDEGNENNNLKSVYVYFEEE